MDKGQTVLRYIEIYGDAILLHLLCTANAVFHAPCTHTRSANAMWPAKFCDETQLFDNWVAFTQTLLASLPQCCKAVSFFLSVALVHIKSVRFINQLYIMSP